MEEENKSQIPDLVETIEEVEENIKRFNGDISSSEKFQKEILSTVQHWYYSEKLDAFGPSKFIGYKNMDFEKYFKYNRASYEEGGTWGNLTEDRLKKLKLTEEISEFESLRGFLRKFGKKENKKATIKIIRKDLSSKKMAEEKTSSQEVKDRQSLFYIVRTSPGKEEKVIFSLQELLQKKKNSGILAMFSPESVKGYFFVEVDKNRVEKEDNPTLVVDALREIPNQKGIIRKPIGKQEIEKYLEKEGEKIIVNEQDTVEIVAGPFKGSRAKVVRLVPGKNELVIEIQNMAVPIPITLSVDDIRVIKPRKEK